MCRHCPAKPATVAAFILDSRLKHDRMLDALNVIARLHNIYSLSNPVATSVVRAVLETVLDDEPPRSWTKRRKTFSHSCLQIFGRLSIVASESAKSI